MNKNLEKETIVNNLFDMAINDSNKLNDLLDSMKVKETAVLNIEKKDYLFRKVK